MFGLNKKRITVLYQYSSTVVQKTQVISKLEYDANSG